MNMLPSPERPGSASSAPLLLLMALCLILGKSARGEPLEPWPPASQGNPDQGLVVSFGPVKESVWYMARTHPPAGLHTPELRAAPIESHAPELLDPLRRTVLRKSLPNADPLCGGLPEATVRYRLGEIQQALHYRRMSAAAQLMNEVISLFQCRSEILLEEEAAAIFFFRGVLALMDGRSEQAARTFARVPPLVRSVHSSSSTTWPDWVRGFPLEVQQALAAATADPPKEALIPIKVPDLAGFDLRINGVLGTGDSLLLVPGQHFLQLLQPDGQVLVSQIWTVDEAAAGKNVFPPALVPPTREWVQQGLENLSIKSLRTLELSPADRRCLPTFVGGMLRKPALAELPQSPSESYHLPALLSALEDMLDAESAHWVLLLRPEKGLDPAGAIWLVKDKQEGLQPVPVALTRAVACRDALRVGGLAITTGLAGAALAFTVTPWIASRVLEEPEGTIAVVSSGQLYATGDLVFGTAFAISLWATIRSSQSTELPRFLYPLRLSVGRTSSDLSWVVSPTAVGLTGQW